MRDGETVEQMRARIAARTRRNWGEGGAARELLREDMSTHREDYYDEGDVEDDG